MTPAPFDQCQERGDQMPEIVLSPEQLEVLSGAEGLVAIRRPDGSFVGWVSPKSNFIIPNECPFTPEEIEAAEKAYDPKAGGRTTKEILDSLNKKSEEPPAELSPSELAEIRRRLASNEPRYTTDEALTRVRAKSSP
jgi:hypothetical protein